MTQETKYVYKIITTNRESAIASYQGAKCLSLKYIKGEKTEAIPGSIGILCFEDEKVAKAWMSGISWRDECQMIRVIPHGEKTVPEGNIGEFHNLNRLYKKQGSLHGWYDICVSYDAWDSCHWPEGTVAYPAVTPID